MCIRDRCVCVCVCVLEREREYCFPNSFLFSYFLNVGSEFIFTQILIAKCNVMISIQDVEQIISLYLVLIERGKLTVETLLHYLLHLRTVLLLTLLIVLGLVLNRKQLWKGLNSYPLWDVVMLKYEGQLTIETLMIIL